VEGFPCFGIDFGFEGGFKGFVGIVGTEEIGVADEEGFFVVVGVDEPAGDAFGAIRADFAGVGVEHIHAVDGDLCIVIRGQCKRKIGSAQIFNRSDRLSPLIIRPTSAA